MFCAVVGVTSPQRWIYSTQAGTSSANTTKSCPRANTNNTPSTPASSSSSCATTGNKTIEAGKWYLVEGNVTITYTADTDATGTLYAYMYDAAPTTSGVNSGTALTTISKIDATKPNTFTINNSATTNKITLSYSITDGKSGMADSGVTCKYSTTSGSYTTNASSKSTTACTLGTALTKGTTYYYQVCATDKVGNGTTCTTGSKKTSGITNPTFATTNTPTTAQSGYLVSQVQAVTFTKGDMESPQYFIYSTRAGTASANTTQSCTKADTNATPSTPKTCTNNSTTSIAANTWYKVSGNISITYTAASTSTGTLYAYSYDAAPTTSGVNSGTASTTISKIEGTPTAPVIQGGTGASGSSASAVTISVKTAGTANSGVKTYDYYKSTSSTAPTSSTTATGTTSGNLTISDNGTTYVWYRTRSNLDKVSSWTGAQVINIDTVTPSTPTITLSDGVASGNWHTSGAFYLEIGEQHNSSGNIYYYNAGSPATTSSPTTTNRLLHCGESNGYVYYVMVCNGAGLCSDNTSYTIYADWSAPSKTTVTYNSGSNAAVWQNNINISLSATDNVGVDHYEIDWDADGIANQTISSTYVPGNGHHSGNNRFRAVDAAGNKGEWSDSVYIAMDTVTPTHTNWWWGEVNTSVARLYIQAYDEHLGPENAGTYNGHNYGVYCPTSTASGGYNNWVWFGAVWDYSSNSFRCDITPATFGHYGETYVTHLYIWDQANNGGYYNQTSVVIPSACSFTSQDFGYTGGIQSWTVPSGCSGNYTLEVWGAQGGSYNSTYYGGLGGYAKGNVSLSAGTTIYVVVGGAGKYNQPSTINNGVVVSSNGGYNGGGFTAGSYGSGGGATHIGTFNSTLADHGNTSGLYLVAGGGGGALYGFDTCAGYGGAGGGTSGTSGCLSEYGGGRNCEGTTYKSIPGTQSGPGSAPDVAGCCLSGGFGYGSSGLSSSVAGGGGGLYGGGSDFYYGGAAGGSGYIGGVSSGSMQTGVRSGNGYARITKTG